MHTLQHESALFLSVSVFS